MRGRNSWALFALGNLVIAVGACSAGVTTDASGGSGGGETTTKPTASSGFVDSVASTGVGGSPQNPCGTQCGPTELCDGVHKGLDDNCDGQVDEGCPCSPGEAESCFKGDPSFIGNAGCFPGTQHCSENGTWSGCIGGNHPTDDPPCFSADPQGCHPISSVPFATAALADGCGNFDDNADAGSSDWSIACPPGVTPCPTPDATGHVQLISSGEYNVTYTKNVGGTPEQCTYPVYVGAPGLRVELSWEFGNTDLDLHMHEPGTTTDFSQDGNENCGFENCREANFEGGGGPEWFPVTAPPGQPVAWDLDPDPNKNSCYFSPQDGPAWQALGMGCHNPRLDLDDISCNPSSTDPGDPDFCNPENINVDFPPLDTWTRIAVHYYPFTSTAGTPVHPNIKIYCNAALAAELGSGGFGNPEAPLTWHLSSDEDQIWYAADVKFAKDECSNTCTVKPIYVNGDTTAKQPVYQGTYGGFGPAYPQ